MVVLKKFCRKLKEEKKSPDWGSFFMLFTVVCVRKIHIIIVTKINKKQKERYRIF